MRNGLTTMMIEIEPELKSQFQAIVKQEDVSMSQLVRKMIREYLSKAKMESK